MSEFVRTITNGRVLEIVLTRPPVNAMNLQVDWDLYNVFKRLHDDPHLLVGLIRSGCSLFSAGADLRELAETEDKELFLEEASACPGGMAGLTEMWELKKPIISAVNGHAVGGGFEIMLASDIVIAAKGAEFWLPEMQRGFLADGGAVQRLGQSLPYHVAMEFMLSGRRMSVLEAKHWGLVNEVVELPNLLPRAREIASTVSKQSPLALQALKEVYSTMSVMTPKDAFEITRSANLAHVKSVPEYPWYERTVTSSDYVEGSKAFIEKRDPEWTDFGEDILAREQASMNEQEDRAKSSLAQVLGKRENV